MNSPHKGQWRRALMFSLICARINGWVNNREAGDLRRHGPHYGVIVMPGLQGQEHIYNDQWYPAWSSLMPMQPWFGEIKKSLSRAVICLQNIHNRHAIALLWSWGHEVTFVCVRHVIMFLLCRLGTMFIESILWMLMLRCLSTRASACANLANKN